MKISEMTNDMASEAILRIATPISNIFDDEASKPLLDAMTKLGDGNGLTTFLPKFVAFCLKDHKGDLYEIIGALTLKPTTAVGKMNFVQTIKELRDSIDEDFIGFFKSSGNATATPGDELPC